MQDVLVHPFLSLVELQMTRCVSRVAKLILSLVLLYFLMRKFGLSYDKVANGIVAPLWLVMAFVIPVGLVSFISVNRWKVFLACMGINESVVRLWRIYLISQFQGLVLPSTQGFDAVRMYHIARLHPEHAGGASGSVLIERMFGVLIWCAMAMFGLPFVLRHLSVKLPVALIVIGFFITAVMGVMVVFNDRIHSMYIGKRPKFRLLARIVSFIGAMHDSVLHFPYAKVFRTTIAMILVCQISAIIVVWLVFLACGVSVPLYVHLAFYPVIAIIAMMPVTIGGFGVREGAFVWFYSFLGVAPERAICVSVVNYFAVAIVPAIVGAIVFIASELCSSIIQRKQGIQ